ncbi:unnamed protein product [Adineta steineri]|uniref:Uncharacterized protein n=1 Tax=Adineta steineri TaxID=433720 RepID=A0A813NEI1_9BILA|nr:unnamed protein product [Adineta steineri]CAF0747264.1 unnamed protein product [Adineta steineri]
MNSNSNYSPFVEHSFRRLSLLIHQQEDVLATNTNKITEQLSNKSLENNINNNDLVSFTSKMKSHQQSTDIIEATKKIESISTRTNRTYMRPPKHQTMISYRCSTSQLSDRSETSFNHSLESPCSPSQTKQESNQLPIHMPYQQTVYDIKFEKERQNNQYQKYNVPPPFQREWLRQPRYKPQERPNFGQTQQSQSE